MKDIRGSPTRNFHVVLTILAALILSFPTAALAQIHEEPRSDSNDSNVPHQGEATFVGPQIENTVLEQRDSARFEDVARLEDSGLKLHPLHQLTSAGELLDFQGLAAGSELLVNWTAASAIFTNPSVFPDGIECSWNVGGQLRCIASRQDARFVVKEFDPYSRGRQITMGSSASFSATGGPAEFAWEDSGQLVARSLGQPLETSINPDWASSVGLEPQSPVTTHIDTINITRIVTRLTNPPNYRSPTFRQGDPPTTIFHPDLDAAGYAATSGLNLYNVLNSGRAGGWVLKEPPSWLASADGTLVWSASEHVPYDALADTSLAFGSLNLKSAASASLSFQSWFGLENGTDYGYAEAAVDNGTTKSLVIPTAGPIYSNTTDGGKGWTGDSAGWQSSTLDLQSFVGHDLKINFHFKSDAVVGDRGWYLRNFTLAINGTTRLTDVFDEVWMHSGDWQLSRPTIGPAAGFSSQNVWNLARSATYTTSLDDLLQLPVVPLAGKTNVTLSFKQWLNTEYGHDYAQVQVSEDKGATWRVLEPFGGPSYDTLPDGTRAWSGYSLGWWTSTFEITPFAGQDLYLRFKFHSDESIATDGWFLSDFMVDGTSPGTYLNPIYPTFVNDSTTFYAYFGQTNTNASFTTPAGATISIKYVGTTGDVIAKWTPKSFTARQAVVGLGGPVSVPASAFVITSQSLNGTVANGTWTIRPAPTSLGFGGTQLITAKKTFDSTSPSSEPIDGIGLGRLSSTSAATFYWNWHNQNVMRYDSGPLTTDSGVESLFDLRYRFDLDRDLDGFSDKLELLRNADPTILGSTPFTDDDQDGIINQVEESRTAALDPVSTTLSPFVNGDLGGEDWETMGLRQGADLSVEGSTLPDYDGDGIPDYRDLANGPGESQHLVGTSASTNHATLSTSKSGSQIAIIITPDWKTALIIELAPTLVSTAPSAINYSAFFQDLDSYYTSNNFTASGDVDRMITTVLRQHLDPAMTYERATLPSVGGLLIDVDLSGLSGTASDGTWLVIVDTDIMSFSLNFDGISLSAPTLAQSLPPIGGLHTAWYFMGGQYAARGWEDPVQCLSYKAFLNMGPCGQIPSTTSMRAYSDEGATHLSAMPLLLREQYRLASLDPGIYDFVLSQLEGPVPDPSDNFPTAWAPGPSVHEYSNSSTHLILPAGDLAAADWNNTTQRFFNWEYYYTPASGHGAQSPMIAIGIEPSDASTNGSTVVLKAAALRTLGFDTSMVNVSFDDAHNSTYVTRQDMDGDGDKDYVFTLAHFSKAWAYVTKFGNVQDLSFPSTSRGFLVTRNHTLYVYDAARDPAWTFYPMDGGSYYYPPEFRAVFALSNSEAWIVGGIPCATGGSLGEIVRFVYNGAAAPTISYKGVPWTGQCQELFDVYAFSSSNVWIAGVDGVYQFDGNFATKRLDATYGPSGNYGYDHLQFYSPNLGWAIPATLEGSYRWDGVAWNPEPQIFTYARDGGPAAYQVTKSPGSAWAVSGDHTNLWQFACDCWTSGTIGRSGAGHIAISGLDPKDAWAGGFADQPGGGSQAAMTHLAGGSWYPNNDVTWNPNDRIYAMDFIDHHNGWAGTSAGAVYQYAGTNTAPIAQMTINTQTPTTNDNVNVDATSSRDPDNDPITYQWDWGDRTAQQTTSIASHRFTNSGTYTITLAVTDSEGATSTTSTTITVALYMLTDGSSLTQVITGQGQQDYYAINIPSGLDLLQVTLAGPSDTEFDVYARLNSRPTTSTFDLAGQSAGSTEDARKLSPLAGTWYVLVTSTSGTGSYTLLVKTQLRPSAPSIETNMSPARLNNYLSLSGASSSANSIAYSIDWADGTNLSRYPPSGFVNGGTAFASSHSYASFGDYLVTVTTEDTYGLTNSNTVSIQVRDFATGFTSAATSTNRSASTLHGAVTSLGGYASVQQSFQYGTTEGYGSWTTARTSTTAETMTEPIAGLNPDQSYHFRAVINNTLGTTNGQDQVFHTLPNLAPGAPSMAVERDISSRGEVVWANGSGIDPEGDSIYFTINWGDGSNNSRYPAGTDGVPSGSAYSVTHTYANLGPYLASVVSTDLTQSSQVSPTSTARHTVMDSPGGSTNTASNVTRSTATLTGSITDLGGDSTVVAWFEYGPIASGYPLATGSTIVLATGPISMSQGGLTEGIDYHYRLVLHNLRGDANGTGVTFATNVRPTLSATDPFPNSPWAGTDVTFLVHYVDSQNEPPAAGFPRLVYDNVRLQLAKPSATDTDYTNGMTYALNLTPTIGPHTYSYEFADSLPDTFVAPSRYGSFTVKPNLAFR